MFLNEPGAVYWLANKPNQVSGSRVKAPSAQVDATLIWGNFEGHNW